MTVTAEARRRVEQASASQGQVDLYRTMAEALRRLDPTYQDCTVNEEVARMIAQAAEFDDDAEYQREQAIAAGFVPE